MSEGKLPISVLVQTKNEEVAIESCINGLADFAEIVIVDSNSDDRTTSIAEALGVRVENFTWDGRYPKKKQWQLENVDTTYDWILFIDADESPTPEFVVELKRLFTSDSLDAYAAADIPLIYVFASKPLRYGHTVVKRALVHRSRVRFPEVDDLAIPGMGELEGHYQPDADGEVLSMRGKIWHDDPDPVRTWFDRHNRYSDWEAAVKRNPAVRGEIRSAKSRQGSIFDRVPAKPLVFFIFSYFIKLGLLDGRAGFDYAVALSFYYWQIGLKTREISTFDSRKTARST